MKMRNKSIIYRELFLLILISPLNVTNCHETREQEDLVNILEENFLLDEDLRIEMDGSGETVNDEISDNGQSGEESGNFSGESYSGSGDSISGDEDLGTSGDDVPKDTNSKVSSSTTSEPAWVNTILTNETKLTSTELLVMTIKSSDCTHIKKIKDFASEIKTSFNTQIFPPSARLELPRLPSYLATVNSNVYMTCESQNRHTWKTTAYYYENGFKHELSEYNGLSGSETPREFWYSSTLHLRRVSAEHVGMYTCTELANPSIAKSIYLYIDDMDNPVSSPYLGLATLTVRQGDPAMIPCRPASPEFSVYLFKDRIPVENCSYHPRLGFVLQNITYEEQAGSYVCLFSSAYKLNERRTVNLEFVSVTKTNGSNFSTGDYNNRNGTVVKNEGVRHFKFINVNLFFMLIFCNFISAA